MRGTRPFLPLLWIGAAAALIIGALSASFVLFCIAYTPFVIIALLWWRNQPPFFVFALLYQWVAISLGFLFREIEGYQAGWVMPGDWDRAVVLSIAGLMALVGGIVIVTRRVASHPDNVTEYSPTRLCTLLAVLYGIDYILILSRFIFGAGASQILVNAFLFREVFLFLLLWQALRTFRGLSYAALGSLIVLVPQLASPMSQFKSVFFMLALATAGLLTANSIPKPVKRRLLAIGMVTALLTIFAGLFWEGAFKPIWRQSSMADAVGHTPMQRIGSFLRYVNVARKDFDSVDAIESLVSRLSSANIYFSNVLNRVPALIDYEHGAFTRSALIHVLMPRLFFPEKETLGSDSWLVVHYAGIPVAGEEQETSVGLGYMAELYIDYGTTGMLLALVLLGMVAGGTVLALRASAPSPSFFLASAAVLFTRQFASYEEHLPKLLGGLVQNTVVFCALLLFVGPPLHRWLLRRPLEEERPVSQPMPSEAPIHP